jgi:hypothetical protein
MNQTAYKYPQNHFDKTICAQNHFNAQSEAAKTQFIEEKKNINELKILLCRSRIVKRNK